MLAMKNGFSQLQGGQVINNKNYESFLVVIDAQVSICFKTIFMLVVL